MLHCLQLIIDFSHLIELKFKLDDSLIGAIKKVFILSSLGYLFQSDLVLLKDSNSSLEGLRIFHQSFILFNLFSQLGFDSFNVTSIFLHDFLFHLLLNFNNLLSLFQLLQQSLILSIHAGIIRPIIHKRFFRKMSWISQITNIMGILFYLFTPNFLLELHPLIFNLF